MSKTQLKILAFIETYFEKHGETPTRQEIANYLCRSFNKCSKSNANYHLSKIEQNGWIKIDRRKNRRKKDRNIIQIVKVEDVKLKGGEKFV